MPSSLALRSGARVAGMEHVATRTTIKGDVGSIYSSQRTGATVTTVTSTTIQRVQHVTWIMVLVEVEVVAVSNSNQVG